MVGDKRSKDSSHDDEEEEEDEEDGIDKRGGKGRMVSTRGAARAWVGSATLAVSAAGAAGSGRRTRERGGRRGIGLKIDLILSLVKWFV